MHIDMHYGVFMGISMWMWMCMCMCAYLYVYKHMYLHTHAYTSCTCTCNGRYTYDIYTCENSAIILRSDKIRICPLLACPTWNNLSVIEDKHKWFLHRKLWCSHLKYERKSYRIIMTICVVISSFSVSIFITHCHHWDSLIETFNLK